MNLDELARHGFRWGPAAIWRITEQRGRRLLGVSTDTHTLEVAISPGGQSLRVWLDGKELTP